MKEDYLAHYGILGMKWGVRRFQPYSVRGRKSGEGGKETGLAKKRGKGPTKEQLLKSTDPKEVWKYKDQFSDKELRDRVNRIQTEQQLQQLVSNAAKNGQGPAKKILKNIGKIAVASLTAYAANSVKNAVTHPVASAEAIKSGIEAAKSVWMNYPWRSK